MHIECLTTRAAIDVLRILMASEMRPGGAFHVTDPWPRGVPIRFSLSAPLPAHMVAQVRAIPDTTIVEKGAT